MIAGRIPFLSLLFTCILCVTPVRSAQAPATTVVYDLYATDGYLELPDGQPFYCYGLVGGREGQDLIYQAHCTPGASDSHTGLVACTGSSNVTVAGGPVPPFTHPASHRYSAILTSQASSLRPVDPAYAGIRIYIRVFRHSPKSRTGVLLIDLKGVVIRGPD